MKVPGQAGRWFAVLVAAPLLIVLALVLLRNPKSNAGVASALIGFAVLFLVYEILWLTGVLDYK